MQKTFCFSKNGECARATLASALHSAVGCGKAIEFLKTGNKTVKPVGQIAALLEASTKRICLKNCESSFNDKAEWILSQVGGVFLARL